MTITIYGIKNCDTMKKARAWLDERNVKYAFHDYRAQGIDRGHLERWIGLVGWIINALLLVLQRRLFSGAPHLEEQRS